MVITVIWIKVKKEEANLLYLVAIRRNCLSDCFKQRDDDFTIMDLTARQQKWNRVT